MLEKKNSNAYSNVCSCAKVMAGFKFDLVCLGILRGFPLLSGSGSVFVDVGSNLWHLFFESRNFALQQKVHFLARSFDAFYG